MSQSQQNDRQTMLLGYGAAPDMLAMDLEILLEPCTGAEFAVRHNVAMDKIMTLCGTRIQEKDEIGTTKTDEVVLKCKRELAKRLAMTVLVYARMQ